MANHVHILVSAATEGESAPFTGMMEKPVKTVTGGREVVSGVLEGIQVRIIRTGPGLVNTVQALTAAIEAGKPDLVIQAGCAGTFREAGMKIGDIGIASEEIDAHLGIEPEDGETGLGILPFPLVKQKYTNRYPIDPDLADFAFAILEAAYGTAVKKGPFITVSTITATDESAAHLHEMHGAIMENMEGSGAAHLALHYGLKFLEIRSASNLTGKRERESWELDQAFTKSALAVKTCIKGLFQ